MNPDTRADQAPVFYLRWLCIPQFWEPFQRRGNNSPICQRNMERFGVNFDTCCPCISFNFDGGYYSGNLTSRTYAAFA